MPKKTSLLQRFFDASLIPSETTDERLAHYHSAAADLAKHFGAVPRDAGSASRVAIDPNCPPSDPWFGKVQDAVKVHWKTFLIKNHDVPRQICRAILLQALSEAAETDWTVTYVVWNSSSSLLPHMGSGAEQSITCEFIIGLGRECESGSSEKWKNTTVNDKELPELDVKFTATKTIQVDELALTKGFADAVGPQDSQGANNGNPNPYWPHNNPQNWVYNFPSRAASTVANQVNKSLAATAPAIKSFGDQLVPASKKYSKELSDWVAGSLLKNDRLTALLWWKQALYSPTLRISYRDLTVAGKAVALAFDIGEVSGSPVPLSVEYFLRETVRNVLPDNPDLSLGEFLKAIKADGAIEPCLPVMGDGSPHRVSLRYFFTIVRHSDEAEKMIQNYVGITESTVLPLTEWSVWLLRERIAEILTSPEVSL